MGRKDMMVQEWSTTALLAANGSTQSDWLNIGKQTPDLEVTRSSTGGTYVFEIDWSRDGGATTASTDTVTTTDGGTTIITGKARWARARVRNTDGLNAFTAHSTVVKRDASTAR